MISCKRKRVVLTMAEKAEVLKLLNTGLPGTKIADIYGVGVSTISDIKKNSASIQQFLSTLEKEDGNPRRKTMKKANNVQVEDAVYKWFMQKRSAGQNVSGPRLCEKALLFNKELGGSSDFKASSGWLRNFKVRHGIHELQMYHEKLSSEMENAKKFVSEFTSFVDVENYDTDFIYNADEMGMRWKELPSKILSTTTKERVTVLACTNSTGSHKLDLFLIDKTNFSDGSRLPVVYRNQPDAWMTESLFLDWYDQTFIPAVKTYQQRVGKESKVLLLVDISPCHPASEFLTRENGKFKVIFLHPSITNDLQPMTQGIADSLKYLYRLKILKKFLVCDGIPSNFLANLNIDDCAVMLAESWKSITEDTIQNSWAKLFDRNFVACEVSSAKCAPELLEIVRDIPSCSDCDTKNIMDWLKCDAEDYGFEILTDSEIVGNVKDCGIMGQAKNKLDVNKGHDEAFKCLQTVIRWYETLGECDPSRLLVLKQLQDIADKKRNEMCE